MTDSEGSDVDPLPWIARLLSEGANGVSEDRALEIAMAAFSIISAEQKWYPGSRLKRLTAFPAGLPGGTAWRWTSSWPSRSIPTRSAKNRCRAMSRGFKGPHSPIVLVDAGGPSGHHFCVRLMPIVRGGLTA